MAQTETISSQRFRPMPVVAALLVALATTAILFGYTWPAVGDALPRWASIAAGQRNASLWTLPMFGLLGGLRGSLVHRINVGATSTRGPSEMMMSALFPIAASAAFGVLLGSAPAAFAMGGRASWGRINLLECVAAVLVCMSGAAVGYRVASAIPNRWGILLGGLAAISLCIVPLILNGLMNGKSALSVASSYGSVEVPPGWTDKATAQLVRISWFGMVFWAAAASLNAAALPLWRRALPPIATAGVFAVALYQQPILMDKVPRTACVEVVGSSLCIPEDVRSSLPEISSGVESVVSRFGFGAIGSGDLTQSIDPNFNYAGDTAEALSAQSTAQALVGADACTELAFVTAGGASGPLMERYDESGSAVGVLLSRASPRFRGHPFISFETNPARYSTVAKRLDRLSDQELRDFLEGHASELATCERSLSEMLT